MIYNLIFEELVNIFGVVIDSWQYTGVEIISFIFTLLFVLIFLFIPLYAFWSLLSHFNGTMVDYTASNEFRRSKRAKNRK